MSTIAERYPQVLERIGRAAGRAGRHADQITLVAVTKTWSAPVVVEAWEVGLRHFGENRAEELMEKRAEVEGLLGPDSGITWHLIGPLQSRKTGLAAEAADFFHALDRLKIAHRLTAHLAETGRTLPVLLEVNVSGEGSKSGLAADCWESDAGQRAVLRSAAAAVAALPSLELQGMMTMAPWDAETAVVREVFRRTRELTEWLRTSVPQAGWTTLSMGMSDDFELAIEEGATHVRVGRALFGQRNLRTGGADQ